MQTSHSLRFLCAFGALVLFCICAPKPSGPSTPSIDDPNLSINPVRSVFVETVDAAGSRITIADGDHGLGGMTIDIPPPPSPPLPRSTFHPRPSTNTDSEPISTRFLP